MSTRKKLLQDHKLTLKKCIDICRANETTTEQLKKISNEDVQYVRKKTQETIKQHSKFNAHYSNECKFCGKKHKPSKELCPTYGKACSNCGIKKPLCLQMQKNKRQKEQKGTPNR
jgi:DNA-binding transcriptional MerR regulator